MSTFNRSVSLAELATRVSSTMPWLSMPKIRSFYIQRRRLGIERFFCTPVGREPVLVDEKAFLEWVTERWRLVCAGRIKTIFDTKMNRSKASTKEMASKKEIVAAIEVIRVCGEEVAALCADFSRTVGHFAQKAQKAALFLETLAP